MNEPRPRNQSLRAILLGGLLPVLIFTFVEEYYGTYWGLVAGMVFGVGEILFEKIRLKKVDPLTWIGNGALLVLGAISLFTKEGIWFKLQPSILEAVMGFLLIGSVLVNKPFLVLMARKQQLFARMPPQAEEILSQAFRGLTARIGVFFLFHAVLAAWAALHWSTRAWAILKGVGFTGSLIAYMVIEMILLRRRIRGRAVG